MSEERESFLHALCTDRGTTNDQFERWLVPALRQVDYGEIASVIVEMADKRNALTADNAALQARAEAAEQRVAEWITRADNYRDRCVDLEARLDIGTGNMFDVVAAENERLRARVAELEAAAQGLIDYRDRAGALGLQVEKLDDFIRELRAAIAKAQPEQGEE